jgi:hypothetical protein
MSDSNGRASTTSVDAPDAVKRRPPVTGAGDYVRGIEDTAPIDIVDRPDLAAPAVDADAPFWDAVVSLDRRVQAARGRLELQGDPALLLERSDEELAADRQLIEWERAQERALHKTSVKRRISRERKNLRTTDRAHDEKARDQRWHRRALEGRKRLTAPDVKLARLFRRSELSSRALIAVVLVGMAWSGVNIQHNLVPTRDLTDPLFWLSYGIDATLSIPLIVIMVQATTSALFGQDVKRGKVVLFELALLLGMVGLNSGPQLIGGHLRMAVEYAVAPVMVAAIIWLHAWVAARYAEIIATVHVPGEEEDDAGRLNQDTAELLDLVVRVQTGLRTGEFVPGELNKPGEVAPSARAIASKLNIGKGPAGTIRDAINRLAKEPTAEASVIA